MGGKAGSVRSKQANGSRRFQTLARMVKFIDTASRPMTTTELNDLLELGGEGNVPRYMREFIKLGIAEECRPVPRSGTAPITKGPWLKTYRRTVRLAEVNPGELSILKVALTGDLRGHIVLMVQQDKAAALGGEDLFLSAVSPSTPQ